MKKLLSAFCIAGLLALSINDVEAQDTRFGLKGGLSLYTLTDSFGGVEETSDSKLGFAAGIFVEKPFTDIFSLQVEGLFVQKGGEYADDDWGDESITLSYVDVPVLLKANIPLEGNATPYLYGGGFVGYLVDASAEEDGVSFEIDEFTNDINYGLSFGAGVSFGAFNLDIRYDLGLADIYDEGDLSDDLGEWGDFFDIGGFESSTSGFMFTAGISF
jgi:hypothetical protein